MKGSRHKSFIHAEIYHTNLVEAGIEVGPTERLVGRMKQISIAPGRVGEGHIHFVPTRPALIARATSVPMTA
jgi:hypothetical protein